MPPRGVKSPVTSMYLGSNETNQIFHDNIDTVFVEISMIAEGEEIEFEALALYHLHIGDVGNADFSKSGVQ